MIRVFEAVLRSGVGIWVALGVVATELAEPRRKSDPFDDAIRDLASGDPARRADAARRLGALARPAARPALESRLRDPDSAVRIAVVTALCELGDRGVLSALREALADEPDAGVRAVLIASIERLGD